MRRNLTLQNAARVALALGAVAMLGGYWSVQQQKISDLQTQIDQLPTVKDKDQLDQFTAAKDKVSLVKDRITLENSINGSAIQAFGGLLLVVTACVSWKNLEATQEKQVTERFTQAINQLGSKEITVRVGGIYALERIAKDSEKDYWTIMEVLTSFIREPVQSDVGQAEQQLTEPLPKITKDVQAALTVIGGRDAKKDPEDKKLDLSGANLVKANLRTANLSKSDIGGSDLSGSNLSGANLSNADLSMTFVGGTFRFPDRDHPSDADLHSAVFRRGTRLISAVLTGADLTDADLTGADLTGADLTDAVLTGAVLSDATLREAILDRVNLSGKDLGMTNLYEAYLVRANLSRTNLAGADLGGSDLHKADLHKADLYHANLRGAQNLSVEQIQAAENWEQAQYDNDFRRKLGLPPSNSNYENSPHIDEVPF